MKKEHAMTKTLDIEDCDLLTMDADDDGPLALQDMLSRRFTGVAYSWDHDGLGRRRLTFAAEGMDPVHATRTLDTNERWIVHSADDAIATGRNVGLACVFAAVQLAWNWIGEAAEDANGGPELQPA